MAINVRRFTRASPSSVTFDWGNWHPLATRSLYGADCAVAMIVRLKSVGVQQVLGDWANPANNSTTQSLHVDATNKLCTYGLNGFGGTTKTSTITLAVDTWYLLGFSRVNAGDVVTFHSYPYGGAWTHDGTYAGAELSNNDQHPFRVGDNNGGANGPTGALDAEVLIAGFSPTALSNAQWESLATDGDTLGLWLSLMGTVWRFDQALNTTDCLDLDTYIAHESAESLTTVVAVTEPIGWGEDAPAGGAGGTSRGRSRTRAIGRKARWY